MRPTALIYWSIVTVLTIFLTPTAVRAENGMSELMTRPWKLAAPKGPAERYQLIDPNALKGATHLRLTYDLNGACLLNGDASAIVFDQPANRTWRYISLAKYGRNCWDGSQTVDIPLSHFPGLDRTKPVGTFHARIWHRQKYSIDITSAVLHDPFLTANRIGTSFADITVPRNIPPIIPTYLPVFHPIPTPTSEPTAARIPTPTAKPSVTSQPTVNPSDTPTPIPPPTVQPVTSSEIQADHASWSIQSVSSMKETKDRICHPRSQEFISGWMKKAVNLGANYVSIETPYENPACGNSLSYTEKWVKEARKQSIRVWHRHMPLEFEGIYDARKDPSRDYLDTISSYIRNNPDLFFEGDIFTPIPEPQNGGIAGITYCAQGICIFKNRAHFNSWLRDAMDASEDAFASIGLAGKMKIGYYGFDGFVAWGDNNPDWNGILEDATVIKMGNITIDHYPEAVGDTMENDLNELEKRYPNFPIIIGEWGTITGGDLERQVHKSMEASRRPSVVGFNYWHLGSGGSEGLIRENFSELPHFDDVASFYR